MSSRLNSAEWRIRNRRQHHGKVDLRHIFQLLYPDDRDSSIHSNAPGIFIKIDQLSGHQTEVVPQSRNVTLSDHTVIDIIY